MMKTNSDLFEGVGNNSHVEQVAVQTAFGMMIPAKTIFEKLGYSVHPTRKAEKDWGKAVLMVKEGSVSIQLTDFSDEIEVSVGGNCIGIMVDDPKAASLAMYMFGLRGGVSVDREEVPERGVWLITIRSILTQPIALVPNPDVCTECHGKGTVLYGQEGKGYSYPCDACKGSDDKP